MAFDRDNFSFMLLGVDDTPQTNMACENETLKNSKQGKVLRSTIDDKIVFATHLLNITKNGNIKFNSLTRVQKYMTTDKKHTFSLFFKSHFAYYPLI